MEERISGHTGLLALIGSPVGHSGSPAMYNYSFARLGLDYTVAGETNLIGFHANGNYNTAVGEMFALMGMTLWAEYLDGIGVADVGTESFTAVETTTGKNPAAEMWYEKDASNNYFRTTDTEPAAGKTYYTRAVSVNP